MKEVEISALKEYIKFVCKELHINKERMKKNE